MPRFDRFLAKARATQREVYAVDPPALAPLDWVHYVVEHLHCAHVELAEAAQCLPLKQWRAGRLLGDPSDEQVEDAVDELVDALCHISNVLVALGVSDDVLNERYDRKVSYTAGRDGGYR